MQVVSRAQALGALGAAAVAAPLAVETAGAAGREDAADLKLLNSLLQTANAGVALYNGAITANVLTPAVAVTIGQFAGDHAAHRDALIALISSGGGQPDATAAPSAPVPPHSDAELLPAALAFERQATGIYLSSIAAFKNRDYAKTAASILGVDAAHVALLAEALRQNPAFPTNFVTA
jgi:bacterioferritin (cytochrome b1)